jgi:hypothetical protein
VQGIAVAERAYQQAVAYARERVQSRPVDGSTKDAVSIIEHPDVRRMLMPMRALPEGCRALATVTAAAWDAVHHHPDAAVRQQMQMYYEFAVPLVKGFSTETSVEVASLGVQVHGGMGFIEETGAAQHYRDARILPIYEGTTGIQANDLVGRKTLRNAGMLAQAIAAQIAATEQKLAAAGIAGSAHAKAFAERLGQARQAFLDAVGFITGQGMTHPNAAFAGGVPYLMLTGNLLAGWQMGRALLAAEQALASGKDGVDQPFMQAKIATARFYADHILPRTAGLREAILHGADSTMALPVDAF